MVWLLGGALPAQPGPAGAGNVWETQLAASGAPARQSGATTLIYDISFPCVFILKHADLKIHRSTDRAQPSVLVPFVVGGGVERGADKMGSIC